MYYQEAEVTPTYTSREELMLKANPHVPSMDYVQELLAAGGKATFPQRVEKLTAAYRSGEMRRVEYLEELGSMLSEEWRTV